MKTGKCIRKALQTSYYEGKFNLRYYTLPVSGKATDILPLKIFKVSFPNIYDNTLLHIKHDSGLQNIMFWML